MAERMRDWVDEQRKLSGRLPRRYPTIEDAFKRMQDENKHLSAEQARHLTQQGVNQNEDGTYSWKFDNYVRTSPPYDMSYTDIEHLWTQIACPTLLIYGKESWASNPEEDGRLKYFKHADVVEFDNAGHWVHHDRLRRFRRHGRGVHRMKAAIFRGGDIVVDTLPEPVPARGQVLVKTLACGICGSDLHAAKHAHRMVAVTKRIPGRVPMDLSRDVVFGHEFCCEVLDYGPDTERTVKPGTRVCAMPLMMEADGPKGMGYSNTYVGGYAEQMLLSAPLLLEVPNGLSTDHAALTEPLAVGVHAVEKGALKGDEAPLVVGCGPVGLAVIAALRLKGIRPIVAADFSPKRRELAVKMGADIVVDPALESPYARLEPGKRAAIFECVGVPGVLQQMFEQVPRDARVVVVGVCMEPDTIEPMFGIVKELSLQFVLGYTPR